MKILKVELQNINSLKSDSPIVIDFENEQFTDVGLYAITGATGAGKTTILDAITIALYHNVPRFSGTKGTLIDVVSHGAIDAFSRVTFENDGVIYEAFWSMRIADKKGKKYKNAKEEVSLKNLTTNAILASQKRNLMLEIIRVTQLDYNQFLRSVMLAQGEFASFLTAKGPEKGKLLEQITGEQIYKKIGEGILERKSAEETKLKEIQAKINADDVLSDERKIELTQKNKELDVQIEASEKETTTIQRIATWYLKFHELNTHSEKLTQDSQEITADIEKHTTEFQLLALNEKAEPFKELIQSFNRNEKSTLEKTNQLKKLAEELALLQPEIERFTKLTTEQSNALENANKEFRDWLPKFEQITQLDGQLKSETHTKQKATEKLSEVNAQIVLEQEEKSELVAKLSETEATIATKEAFVLQNKFLSNVASEISNWTTGLTTLKANKETLHEHSNFVVQKKKEIENTTLELTSNKELLTQKLAEIAKIETEGKAIAKQLAENNLTDLLAEEKKQTSIHSNWKEFKGFSEEITQKAKESDTLLTQEKIFLGELEVVKKQITTIKTAIKAQEIAVEDAEKILNLEKSISKYEDDRQNLLKGKPCGLCGATEHPFAENLPSKGVSASELELTNRKNQLKTLVDSKSELDKNEVKLNTSIESLTLQIHAKEETVKTIQLKVKLLNLDCDIYDVSKINIELNTASEKLQIVNQKITTAQQLQTKKDELSHSYRVQHQAIETLKTKDATLGEKVENAKTEIATRQTSIDALTKTCATLENELKTNLATFKYELPSIENTHLFIETIEKKIHTYNDVQKSLDALKAEVKVLANDLNTTEKQLATHAKTQEEFTKIIQDSNTKTAQLTTKRISLLPIDISVETKRNSLQSINNQLVEKVELSKKEWQRLVDTKKEKEAVKVEYIKEQTNLSTELNTLNSSLETQLKESDFTSKQEIEKALLSEDDKRNYTQIQKRIRENQLRLQTLTEANVKEKEALLKTKNFDTSEAESHSILEELKTKKNTLLAEKGEIKEAFRKDEEIKNRNQEVYKMIEAQEAVCTVWKELFKIIGNSKDAFNVYVQRLTLKRLLVHANAHLYKLNKRYSLKMSEDYKPKEELNFNLIDHYQTNQARLVDTSSGGEKFIISLALALGLSDLASKNVKIDSLFIDEGFGTLDSNTLETVISTLETLQSQGKMIGIISHVENLKERIPTQIQITKKSNGVSVVDII